MPRYCSHTVILPDETSLDNFVVEVNHCVEAYYPFMGETHSTIYLDTPILLSPRADLEGKTVSLARLAWALCQPQHPESAPTTLYAYLLTPCPTCMGDRYTMSQL